MLTIHGMEAELLAERPVSDADTLRIRPLQEPDIEALEGLGHRPPGLARKRWIDQEAGLHLVMLATVDRAYVGHAVLTWDGCESPPLPEPIEGCPDISDVWVHPEWRRHGIGDALLDACEQIASSQGFQRIGLGVGIVNHGARALYASRNYRHAGQPVYDEAGRWQDASGIEQAWSEHCEYFVRQLP